MTDKGDIFIIYNFQAHVIYILFNITEHSYVDKDFLHICK